MLQNIKLFITLFALGLVCQNFGPISNRLEGVLLLTSLVSYLFICVPIIKSKNSGVSYLNNDNNSEANQNSSELNSSSVLPVTILSYIALIAIALSLSWVTNDLIQLCILIAFLLCILLFSKYRGLSTIEHTHSILITSVFLLIILLYTYFTDCWYVVGLYSALFSNICGFIYARILNLGPTSFGFFILVSFVIYHTTRFALSKQRSVLRLSFALLYLFATTIVVVGINLLVVFIASKTKLFSIDRNDLHTQFFLFLIMCPSVLFYKHSEFQSSCFLMIKRNYKYAIPTVVAFVALITFLFVPFMKSATIEDKTVAFYKKGSLDWNSPRFGNYGQRSGGMFGLMPKHLKVLGYNSIMIDDITLKNLDGTDVLVMINLDKALSREELLMVWNYVKHGGGLLLLGDHTDLAGLMKNFNQILKIVNIKFKFDSAMPTRYTWDSLLDYRLHPISNTFEMETGRSWWVGASLECTPPAEPIVLGKYCYSDWGYKNNAKNAYLGNRRFDYYEPLNDHVLAAYSRYEDGKVMAVGDTSSYHNTTFMVTNSFVLNTFRYLSDNKLGHSTLVKRILLGLLILSMASCLVFSLMEKINIILPLSFTFIIGVALISVNCMGFSRHDDSTSFEKTNVAYIDFSHKERFDLMSWEDDSIGGLRNNIMRNGYFPVLMRDFDAGKLLKSKLLVIIAPTQPFTNGEIETLKLFAENGGKIVVSVGWEEMAGSSKLLEAFNFEIDGTPLGWCDFEYKKTKIQFHEAWPVVYGGKDEDVEVICEPLGYPAVVSKKIGKGSIVVIGDSYFLLNQNLEGSKKYSTPNIFLLRNLLLN